MYPYCHKSFSETAHLYHHIRQHPEMLHAQWKQLVCPYCDLECSSLATLVYHVRQHTNEKPYKCFHPKCDKKFAGKSNLKKHLSDSTLQYVAVFRIY